MAHAPYNRHRSCIYTGIRVCVLIPLSWTMSRCAFRTLEPGQRSPTAVPFLPQARTQVWGIGRAGVLGCGDFQAHVIRSRRITPFRSVFAKMFAIACLTIAHAGRPRTQSAHRRRRRCCQLLPRTPLLQLCTPLARCRGGDPPGVATGPLRSHVRAVAITVAPPTILSAPCCRIEHAVVAFSRRL